MNTTRTLTAHGTVIEVGDGRIGVKVAGVMIWIEADADAEREYAPLLYCDGAVKLCVTGYVRENDGK